MPGTLHAERSTRSGGLRLDRSGLVALNVLGGAAVLGSYASVFGESEAVRAGLWGGVPLSLQGIYVTSMLLAAAGYFAFSWLLVLSRDRVTFESETDVSYTTLVLFYALVLIPSALWLPLTVQMIQDPGPLLWVAIRLVLFLVGAGSVGILWLCSRYARIQGGATRWIAVAGAVAFVVQTGVLDALVWPAYYPD